MGQFDNPYNSSYGALMLGWYSRLPRLAITSIMATAVGTYNLKGGLLTGVILRN